MVDNIEMIGNNILVYIKLPTTQTDAGIILDEKTARETQKDITGLVVAVGDEVTKFSKDDKIILPPHSSTPVSIDGEVYHVFRESMLFAKIN
jgi:co-chaperonin GroES (HSP10)|tara:strand:- start:573 stop:848 length:276 start_codon:yes stop_codon:yes gene_type:complete